jgi:hypothetical protein
MAVSRLRAFSIPVRADRLSTAQTLFFRFISHRTRPKAPRSSTLSDGRGERRDLRRYLADMDLPDALPKRVTPAPWPTVAGERHDLRRHWDNMNCTPIDALEALAVVLAPYLSPLLTGALPRPFSQADGERPPGAGRAKFLRTWRRARDAGDAGAWAEGRARLMSEEAWARWSRTERARVLEPATPLLEELGGRRVGA